jgi:MGT family glycosyltransferase
MNPALPLVRALVDRGDEVVVWSSETFAGRIAAAGAAYRPYASALPDELLALPRRLEELAWILMQTTAGVLERLDEYRAERADYVITDSVAPWGRWVGDILRLPVVTSVSTFAFNRHVMAYGLSHGVRPKSVRLLASKINHLFRALRLGRALRRRYGTTGPGIAPFVSSDLNIVYTSRAFQPCAETFDARYEFVGPTLAPRDGPAFPWERVGSAPIVYVSLGTIFNVDSAFYRDCFDALEGLDVQVIASAGSAGTLERLGPVPPNVLVQSSVPQLEVLARARAFVTHGGMNSVTESLCAGVPVVVIPQMSEQAIVGHRTAELGAGLVMAREDATVERLRASVERLLGEDGFRRQARALGDSLRAAGGAARAAEVIQRFTRARRAVGLPA